MYIKPTVFDYVFYFILFCVVHYILVAHILNGPARVTAVYVRRTPPSVHPQYHTSDE